MPAMECVRAWNHTDLESFLTLINKLGDLGESTLSGFQLSLLQNGDISSLATEYYREVLFVCFSDAGY